MKKELVPMLLTILLTLILAALSAGCGGGGNASADINPSAGGETDAIAPANFTATAVSSSRIDLSWNAAADDLDVLGYRIYRNGTFLALVSGLSVSDTNLKPLTTHCYRITAVDAAGSESAPGDETCAATFPPWSGTKQPGSNTFDNAFGTVVDEIGNVYVTGVTYGDLDGHINAGEYDIILVKYNDSGVKQWTRQLGSSSDDFAYSITVAPNGDIYVAGYTAGDLDGNISAGKDDIVLLKYNAAGTKLWTRQLGSPDVDEAFGVAVDGAGNVYVAGVTYSSLDGYPREGEYDTFLVKYNSAGEEQWIRQMGSAATDEAYALAVDTNGNAYITGLTAGDLDGNTGAGECDMFLVKYDAAGTKQWTRQLGTPADDYGTGVAVDADGNIYVAGTTSGDLDGNSGAGGEDIFLIKFNAAGTVQWIRQTGTATDDESWGIAVDANGNIFVAGSTDGELDGNTSAGGWDMALVKYNPSGEKQWVRQMGTDENDEGLAITTNADGYVFVAGYTYGNLDGNVNAGGNDIFVAKYDTAGGRQ